MSESDITVDGVLGERVRWLLGEIERFSPDVRVDSESALKSDDPQGFFTWLHGQLAGFDVESVSRQAEHLVSLRVRCPTGRTFGLSVRLEEQEPHRIEWVGLDRALLDGIEVREATEADAPAIREVCSNSEIVLRDETVTIDPGDYWASIRLMEFSTVLVATHHQRVVGVHCGAFYPIRYGGDHQWMSQILHSRALPDEAWGSGAS